MVYVKQSWVNNDPTKPLSATRLNKLETQYDEAISQVATDVANDASDIGGALSTKIVALGGVKINPLEGVAFHNFGDSYGDGPQGADQVSRPFNRLAKRHRTADITLRAEAGKRMDEIAQRIYSTWVANSRGLIGFSDGVINDLKQYGNDGARSTTREAFRACLAMLTAKAINKVGTAALAFSAGWSGGITTTAGEYARVAVTAPTVYLLLGFYDTEGGSVTVKNGSTTLATVNTNGFARDIMGAVKITGLTGTTELTVTAVSGTARIYGVAIPSAYPPVIVWDKPGRYSSSTTEANRLALYLAECAGILGDFPSVLGVDMDSGWDYTTMIGPDATHRNDYGNIFAADRIDAALAAFLNGAPRQGLNRLILANSETGADVAYVAPTATPIVVVNTWAGDSFSRTASTPGTTEVGGLTWVQNNGSTGYSTNGTQLAGAAVAVNANDCYVDTAHADGTVTVVITNTAGSNVPNAGIVFRASGTNNLNGYIFWSNNGVWTLSKRTGLTAYTQIATGGSSVGQSGATISVVLNGTSIVCKVNGATVISTTDASYTGTRHGVWANNNISALWDDFAATDSLV